MIQNLQNVLCYHERVSNFRIENYYKIYNLEYRYTNLRLEICNL